jgi:hypothetical protein
MIIQDTPFPQQWGEARRVWEFFFDLLMPSIPDVSQAIRDADDLMPVGLAFHESDQVDIAVRRHGASRSRTDQNHADEVSTPSAADMSKGDGDDLFVGRFVNRLGLFWRFRDFEEFRVEFFPSRESSGIVRVHLDFLCHLNMVWE